MGEMNNKKPLLSKNIIARRKALGWSGEDLAEKAGLPYPTLRDIEAGISGGWKKTKKAIADALDCTIDDLYAPISMSDMLAPDVILKTTKDVELDNRALRDRIRTLESQLAKVEGPNGDIIAALDKTDSTTLRTIRGLLELVPRRQKQTTDKKSS